MAPRAARYERCIEASKRIRWDPDRDVLRGRDLDFDRAFLPASLTRAGELPFLVARDARFLSHVQARTYANMRILAARFVAAKALDLGQAHGLRDGAAFEALVRLADEALKHRTLFARLEAMAAGRMPGGYVFRPRPLHVARSVRTKSTWAVLALLLELTLATQAHHRASVDPAPELSPVWRDVFLFHWKEGSQHAILHELEWRRADAPLDDEARDRGVGDLVALMEAMDRLCALQARADAAYFVAHAATTLTALQAAAVADTMHKAYRGQYVATGATEPRFVEVLSSLVTPAQLGRVGEALVPVLVHAMR